MPFQIPTRDKIVSQLKDYVRGNITNLDTTKTLKRYTSGMTIALASGLHDWYLRLSRYINKDAFWQDCSPKYLLDPRAWWNQKSGLSPHVETASSGFVVVTGVVGTVLAKASVAGIGSRTFTTKQSAIVSSQTLILGSLVASGGVAIAESVSPHFLASGMSVQILDAGVFDGIYIITVTADNEFTFASDLAQTATGTPKISASFASVELMSEGLGQVQNVDGGVQLNLQTVPVGLDAVITVGFDGLSGGSDAEDVENYRERIGEGLSFRKGLALDIEWASLAKNVPGITHAWVRNAQQNPQPGWPLPGQTRIAVMRGKDADPYPSAREVEAVKQVLLRDNDTKLLPSHVVESNIMIFAPTRKAVDFEFSAITPNNAEMREAIGKSLQQYFAENVRFGSDYPLEPDTTLYQQSYNCAIMGAVTPTGSRLTSFVLAKPLGDITKQPDELFELGAVTYG